MTVLGIILISVFFLGIAVLIITRILAFTGRKPSPRSYRFLLLPLLAGIVIHGYLTLGPAAFMMLFLSGLIIPTLLETLMLRTDLVGKYGYSKNLGSELPGGVPAVVAVMWGIFIVVIFWSAQAVCNTISSLYWISLNSPNSSLLARAVFCITAVSLALLLDLVLDPVMVKGGFWSWKQNGGWHGVPYMNYVGWGLTILLIFMVFTLLFDPLESLFSSPFHPLVRVVYAMLLPVTMIDLGITAYQRGLTGPALIGLAGGLGTGLTAVLFWL